MEETIVLVVGAGPAGLGIAACLTKKSIPHIILEKEDCCASLWKKRTYDRCHLHLAKEFCSLPLKPHAPHAKKYLGKDDFIDYIDEYVSEFDIRPRYFKSVESASFDEATGKWLVETKNTLQKVTIVFVASFLVIATGENGKGYIPDIPGLKDFKGDVLHSSEYKSGREFKDKNVLVVGCGNSGMQISYDLCIWEPPLQLLLEIRSRYFHSVEFASFDEAKGKWIVEAKDTLVKVTRVFVASFLVVATGENGKGYIPNIPGLKDFKGDIMHSSEYKSSREFQDKNVLVVGCGNSGMEISYDLCNSGANTSIVIRNMVHVVIREMIIVGMHLLKYFSLSTVDALVTFASRLTYWNLSKYGICRPNEGPFLLKATKGRSPVLDVGTIAEIQSRKIKVLPGIERINKSKIIFEDKVALNFDAIIFATGYKSTTCEWLKDYDYILNKDGFPKNRFPTHWKGNNNVYCARLSRMGLQGISKDVIAIANDIEMILRTRLCS
uniref:Flavin-containing monooxygenase n=1 Tax=Chenopodium quinoa TaxID=63459 RepID=A0A803MHM4_CHEQI